MPGGRAHDAPRSAHPAEGRASARQHGRATPDDRRRGQSSRHAQTFYHRRTACSQLIEGHPLGAASVMLLLVTLALVPALVLLVYYALDAADALLHPLPR